MLSRFKELKRQFSISDSRANKEREEVIEELLNILNKPPSLRGYAADINSTLEEHSMTQKDYLKLILLCFSHQSRTEEEALLIFGYLFYMKVFTSMITKVNSPYINETLQSIASNLEYQKVEADTVLMRYGEKGKKAYIILDGLIDILIKTSKRMLITEKDYLKYIATLLVYNEYGLVNIVLNDNYFLYPLILKDLNNEMASLIIQTRKSSDSPIGLIEMSISDLYQLFDFKFEDVKQLERVINYVSCEEYIERFNVVKDYYQQQGNDCNHNSINSHNHKGKKLIEFNIYSYVIIASKGTGALFGQLALSNPTALRTATIISKSQSHFAILFKSTYNLCLAVGEEKNRKNSILFILSTKLFKQVSYDFMDKKFFNNFTHRRIEKGTLLIEENQKPNKICLLKEGVYEVSIKNSLKYLLSLLIEFSSKLKDNNSNNIESSCIVNKEKEYEIRCLNDNQFCKYYLEKRTFKINYLQCPEVIGLKDYTDNNGLYAFTVECKSPKGELYEMTTDFYNDICQKDWSVKPNERELRLNKYAWITYHLNTIINSVIKTFKASDKDVFTSVKEKFAIKKETPVKISSKRIIRNTLVDIRHFPIFNPDNGESENGAITSTKLDYQLKTETSFMQKSKSIKKSNTFNLLFAPIKPPVYKESETNSNQKQNQIKEKIQAIIPLPQSNQINKTKLSLRIIDKSIQREINKLKKKFNEYHTYYFLTDNYTRSTTESIRKKTIQKININKILFETYNKKAIIKQRGNIKPKEKTIVNNNNVIKQIQHNIHELDNKSSKRISVIQTNLWNYNHNKCITEKNSSYFINSLPSITTRNCLMRKNH